MQHPLLSGHLIQIETIPDQIQLIHPKARRATARWEAIMWRKQREYPLGVLLDHPVLTMVMRSVGMERRSVELLLETAADERALEPRVNDEPIIA